MQDGTSWAGRSPWGPRDREEGPGRERRPRHQVTREVVEEIAVLGSSRWDGSTKELNLISYNGAPAKLDIRVWYRDATYGEKAPGKGITLAPAEARALRDALNGRTDI